MATQKESRSAFRHAFVQTVAQTYGQHESKKTAPLKRAGWAVMPVVMLLGACAPIGTVDSGLPIPTGTFGGMVGCDYTVLAGGQERNLSQPSSFRVTLNDRGLFIGNNGPMQVGASFPVESFYWSGMLTVRELEWLPTRIVLKVEAELGTIDGVESVLYGVYEITSVAPASIQLQTYSDFDASIGTGQMDCNGTLHETSLHGESLKAADKSSIQSASFDDTEAEQELASFVAILGGTMN